jgi:hypothetical protein
MDSIFIMDASKVPRINGLIPSSFLKLFWLNTTRSTPFINFTARVRSSPEDVDVHLRQDIYFRALQKHCPHLKLHFGHFLRHKVYMPLAKPDTMGATSARVIKTEEKGSDVNLSVHLLNDAWLNKALD